MGIVVTGWKMMVMPPIRPIELGDPHRASLRKFDDDHAQLISLFQELDNAVRCGKSKTAMRLVLLGLGSYAQEHFASEEEVMERIAYPDYDAHVAEHREFAARVQDFTRAYEIGDTGVSLELLSYLRAWLHRHICVTDHAMCAYVNGGHGNANRMH